jgi:uncharacterized LabA/DUF88 family protein
MDEKVMLFIDGENLFHGCKSFREKYHIDLFKLRDKLVGERKLIRAYYYHSIPTDNETVVSKQKGFHRYLDLNGFKTVILPLKKRQESVICTKCGNKGTKTKNIEKGVDIALVTDFLTFGIMGYYDTAIIISGDFDYYKAIEEVQRRGAKVELAYFKEGGISSDFIRHSDSFINLDEIADEVEATKKGS